MGIARAALGPSGGGTSDEIGPVANLMAGVQRRPAAQLSAEVVVPGAVPGVPDLVGEPEDTTPVELGTLMVERIQSKQH